MTLCEVYQRLCRLTVDLCYDPDMAEFAYMSDMIDQYNHKLEHGVFRNEMPSKSDLSDVVGGLEALNDSGLNLSREIEALEALIDNPELFDSKENDTQRKAYLGF